MDSESKAPWATKENLVLIQNTPFSAVGDFVLGWRDISVVKSTSCSSRGPRFNSQQPHGGSQPFVMGSDALFWSI